MSWKIVGAAAMALAVAACGTDRTDRTTGGAATGAATGAAVGALGGPVGALAGAAIGGAAGGVTGATTSPRDVNLGTPPWSNPEVRTPLDSHNRRTARHDRAGRQGRDSVREAQQALNDRGFNAGQPDGIWGPRTASAVREFQRANNIDASGRLNGRTMQALNVGDSSSRTGTSDERNRAYMGGGRASGTMSDNPASPAPYSPSGSYTPGSPPPASTTTGVGGTTPSGSSAPAPAR